VYVNEVYIYLSGKSKFAYDHVWNERNKPKVNIPESLVPNTILYNFS